ncbi:hypothetical protein MAR_023654 [Mya arenaria]|uniref:Uncharacterized protein n=1 Tax=Mya arenaria TaxID=6604 RepID=A0ABY7DQV5_MYAAR|nr:uncharacterized protein LOC128226557 [Mya arenaria]WAQ99281.1 hypothetical protein MAR_023654 [Mya arenaria]
MCRTALNGFILCVLSVIIYFCAAPAEAGECCRSHRDIYNVYQYQQWCPVYCCNSGIFRRLQCCSDPARRAFPGDIDSFCAAWFIFPHNVWIPVIIGLVILGILIGICVCCVRCCCVF